MLIVTETLGEKVRERNSIDFTGIHTDTLRNEKPVQICTYGKSQRCPECFRNTCHKSNGRKSHQKPGTHVRSLRTHRGNDRTEFSATKIEIIGILILLTENGTDNYHAEKIDTDSDQNNDISS